MMTRCNAAVGDPLKQNALYDTSSDCANLAEEPKTLDQTDHKHNQNQVETQILHKTSQLRFVSPFRNHDMD
jgi:hypothetical protein